MLQIFSAGKSELVVPLVAEAAAQRSFEKFKCAYAFGTAQYFRGLAYLPAMKIDGRHVGIFFYPHRVQVT